VNGSVYSSELTVTNIGCAYVFDYYSGVAAALDSGSLYPCYICLSNSSCEYCNGGKCAGKFSFTPSFVVGF
jgi:hypothetical protein